MYRLRSLISVTILFLLAVTVGSLQAQDGLVDALARLDAVSVSRSPIVGAALATADFNNDAHPDGAVLFRHNSTFRIEIHFRFRRITRIEFASPYRTLALSAFDVNHDGKVDLVVEEPFSHQRLFVWLNDGSGSFHSALNRDESPGPQNSSFLAAEFPPNPLSQAITTPGKLRVRADLSSSIRLPAGEDRVESGLPSIRPLPEFASAPNFLRGPPAILL